MDTTPQRTQAMAVALGKRSNAAVLFSPVDYIGKLSALIPRPQHHLVRYH
jgi:hypothetical protein|tara:strand:- start:314 stop:463 length:150 start_codon:yes stop_codon:yes gene_type:complete